MLRWERDIQGTSSAGPFRLLFKVGVIYIDPTAANVSVFDLDVCSDDQEKLKNFEGPQRAFDVLDWTSGVVMHGAYMKIGEPYVWRCVSELI